MIKQHIPMDTDVCDGFPINIYVHEYAFPAYKFAMFRFSILVEDRRPDMTEDEAFLKGMNKYKTYVSATMFGKSIRLLLRTNSKPTVVFK